MDLGPADPGRPTHKLLQKSKNYDILIWCHPKRTKSPKYLSSQHKFGLSQFRALFPPHCRDERGFALSFPAAHNAHLKTPVKRVIRTCIPAIFLTTVYVQKAYSNLTQGATAQWLTRSTDIIRPCSSVLCRC